MSIYRQQFYVSVVISFQPFAQIWGECWVNTHHTQAVGGNSCKKIKYKDEEIKDANIYSVQRGTQLMCQSILQFH